jgi:hypothetical protein
MNEQPMTRREARELERQRAATGEIRVAVSNSPASGGLPVEAVPMPDFSTGTGPVNVVEPKSLVLTDPRPDISNLTVVLPDSGAVLTTGAIELPWLKETEPEDVASTVSSAAIADAATVTEIEEHAVVGIDPIPARVYMKSRRKSSVFPDRLRKGWGVVHLVLVSAFIMLLLFAGLLASIMFGFIKF